MRVAYADPPYLGQCKLYGHHHPDGRCWDEEATHAALIGRLCAEFVDGWALSCHTVSLQRLLVYCPDQIRIGAWVKPFASFKVHVTPAFAWEPVLFLGGRRRSREEWSGRDWIAAMPPIFSGEACGVPGMKPETFGWWIMRDLLGLRDDDEFVDLFPGSGAIGRVWDRFQRQHALPFDAGC